MTIVVIGSQCWGKGDTLAEAKRQFSNQGARLSNGYAVLTFDDETEFKGIDEVGRYHYVGNAPTIDEHQPRKREGKRVKQ